MIMVYWLFFRQVDKYYKWQPMFSVRDIVYVQDGITEFGLHGRVLHSLDKL